MESTRRIARTDLSPDAHWLLEAVKQGEPVLVELEEGDEAVLIDSTDYRLLRATLSAVTQANRLDSDAGLSESSLPSEPSSQGRYDRVIRHYLAGAISLSRAAELLDCSPSSLRSRFSRLGLPLRTAPSTSEEAQRDVETALQWTDESDS